ncbi:ASN_collapsed_G0023560.mRNA.1.CDS.1 [Saccharomyces cerevisiae]|nr:ASN_collapsed_G0023560.mRNA.1.CDS.1 [Saccharomyces cerevisiae]
MQFEAAVATASRKRLEPGSVKPKRTGDSPWRHCQEVRRVRRTEGARDYEHCCRSRGKPRAGIRSFFGPGKVLIHVPHPDASAGEWSAIL